MMLRKRLLLLALALLIATACENPFSDDDTDSSQNPQLHANAQDFISVMNEHRVSQGLSALIWHDTLGDVAQAHSEDMRNRNFFAHTNPDDVKFHERITAAGISFQAAGENIAAGQTTGEAVFDAWINSPDGHKENIENATYTHHGVGYVEDGNYWTHVFARNPSMD